MAGIFGPMHNLFFPVKQSMMQSLLCFVKEEKPNQNIHLKIKKKNPSNQRTSTLAQEWTMIETLHFYFTPSWGILRQADPLLQRQVNGGTVKIRKIYIRDAFTLPS